MKTISGRTAVVTGGGNGLGRSIALALADRGADVAIADIRLDDARVVAEEIRSRGRRALAVEVDVADPRSVAALADRAFAEFGGVDILINNAGVNWRPLRTVIEASLEDWRFILGVNLFGVIHGLDAFLPRMRRQPGEKHIVNTASFVSVVPLAGMTPYTASKAAVAALSETMARELAQFGFGVTILCPGIVRTEFGAHSEALRGPGERGVDRTFATQFEDPLQPRVVAAAIGPEAIGAMVCEGILSGQLYLHTQPIDGDMIVARQYIQFGPQTQART